MKNSRNDQFHAKQFAQKAGVSVRTLHHYDRLGLLKPRGRTAAGYRLYGPSDFARLQQIVTLKFIGFPLHEIKKLLAGADLAAALRLQRRTLEEKQRQLAQAVAAIARAERLLRRSHLSDWGAFAKIIEAIQMQNKNNWTKQYYNEEAQKLIAERQHLWSPELQKEVEQQWSDLFRDIENAASKGADPASAESIALVQRQKKLIEGFTGGHAAICDGLNELWADQDNWPEEMKQQVYEPFAQRGHVSAQAARPRLLSPAAEAFINKASEAAARINQDEPK